MISVWHDRWILAGKEWAREIDHNLNDADLILLLVSETDRIPMEDLAEKLIPFIEY